MADLPTAEELARRMVNAVRYKPTASEIMGVLQVTVVGDVQGLIPYAAALLKAREALEFAQDARMYPNTTSSMAKAAADAIDAAYTAARINTYKVIATSARRSLTKPILAAWRKRAAAREEASCQVTGDSDASSRRSQV